MIKKGITANKTIIIHRIILINMIYLIVKINNV